MPVEFYRGSPGKFDSRTLSRKTLSRWTGFTPTMFSRRPPRTSPRRGRWWSPGDMYVYMCICIHTCIHSVKHRLLKTQIQGTRWFYTLSQCFVWITVLLFNQLAEFWVAYFRVVYFPAIVCADPNLEILSLKIGRNNN